MDIQDAGIFSSSLKTRRKGNNYVNMITWSIEVYANYYDLKRSWIISYRMLPPLPTFYLPVYDSILPSCLLIMVPFFAPSLLRDHHLDHIIYYPHHVSPDPLTALSRDLQAKSTWKKKHSRLTQGQIEYQ